MAGSGTTSFGKHQKITHIRCRRCGRHSYHNHQHSCAACGYPRAKIRNEAWRNKFLNRKKRKPRFTRHQKVKTARMGRWPKNG